MESRSKTNSAPAASDADKASDEEETNSTPVSRITRMRTNAEALASARRNSATIAARRSLTKARTAIANRAGQNLPNQGTRRSSRSTPGSKKAEADEQATVDEKTQQQNELETIKKKLGEPYIIESATCQYNYVIYKLCDIISIGGTHDQNLYYAKILGFFTNKYAERFVQVRWLIPKFHMGHPMWKKVKEFDLDMYNEGPRGEELIAMDKITFVDRFPLQIDHLGEPFLLFKDNRWINILTDKPLSSAV
jgi:hypothetical protein